MPSFPLLAARRGSFIALAAMFVMLVGAASASAEPVWRIDSVSNTTAQPGAMLTYYVQIVDVGTEDSNGEEIKTTITLPAGVTGVSGTGVQPGFAFIPDCTAMDGVSPVTGESTIRCDTTTTIPNARDGGNAGSVRYTIVTHVDPGVPAPSTVTASFNTTGGGAPEAGTAIDSTRIDNPPGFGVEAFDGQILADQAGDPMSQAGGHPYAISTAIDFNTVANPLPLLGDLWPVEATKDALVDLPPGLVGSVASVDQCTAGQLAHSLVTEANPTCPPTSQVGTTLVRTNGFPNLPNTFGPIPVFNMVPPLDAPAQFGFNVSGTVVTLTARARSATDYGVSIDGNDIPEGLAIAGSSFTFWGVPSDSSHDSERACPGEHAPWAGGPTCPSGTPRRAFLRMPTSCSAAAGAPVTDGLTTNLSIDSWDHPGARDTNTGEPAAGDTRWQKATWVTHEAPGYPAPPPYGPHTLPTGCEKVPFTPALSLKPEGASLTSTPTPFTVDLSLPQSDDPSTIGEGDLKKAVVTLPAGVRISPSSAGGLGACSPAQIGLGSVADPTCPDSSKVAAVTVTTPLLPQKLTGGVYLATPHDNPFNALIAIYIVVKGPGVNVKLAGHVETDPTTGQISTTFDDPPQLPFSLMHLEFNGGPRAPLTTPTACGTYTTHSVLTSWSGKTVTSDSPFTVDANSDGTPCSPLGFSPAFTAGVTNPVAGGFSPFRLRLQRSGRDSEFQSLSSVSLPPGLLADVASVPTRCTEAQATAAACPPASHIGQVTVGSGAGSNPFYVTGDVYLMGAFSSGPFRGDPFGLAFVVHALAGPFDLGYVVVRAGIQIHNDGSISTVAEPFPQILEGIPLQVRDVRVSIDRPGFIFNPTSCTPMAINATAISTAGQSAPVSSRFQVGECASLSFHPSFSVSTRAQPSKASGASLHVHVSTKGAPGSASNEANIAKVNVSLPLALPSRLTTLQKACTSAQFQSNPAGCPEASFVGTAIAHTPVLSSALSGPAILVSHGGVAFPDLVIVLQGEGGIRLDLVGNTRIKNGITFSKFEAVPDAPVSSFDLDLPQGSHSVLTTNASLCRTVVAKKRVIRRAHGRVVHRFRKVKRLQPATLLMPTTITGQNGLVMRQTTRIAVTGCAAPKAAKTRATRKKHAKTGRKR